VTRVSPHRFAWACTDCQGAELAFGIIGSPEGVESGVDVAIASPASGGSVVLRLKINVAAAPAVTVIKCSVTGCITP